MHKMLLREYDVNCVMNRKIYCDDNIIVRYSFKRQFDCKTICVLCFYYFEEIIFKYCKNKCIYNSFNTYLGNIVKVIGNDFCRKILSEFT